MLNLYIKRNVLYLWDLNISLHTRCWGEGGECCGTGFPFGVVKMFWDWMAVMFAHHCEHIKNHWNVLNFMTGELCAQLLGRIRLFAALRTVAGQAPLSMGFSRQEYWSGLPFPPPGDLPNPGIKPTSLAILSLTDRFFTTSGKSVWLICVFFLNWPKCFFWTNL